MSNVSKIDYVQQSVGESGVTCIRNFQVYPKVWILQIWLCLCIKLVVDVNTFRKLIFILRLNIWIATQRKGPYVGNLKG